MTTTPVGTPRHVWKHPLLTLGDVTRDRDDDDWKKPSVIVGVFVVAVKVLRSLAVSELWNLLWLRGLKSSANVHWVPDVFVLAHFALCAGLLIWAPGEGPLPAVLTGYALWRVVDLLSGNTFYFLLGPLVLENPRSRSPASRFVFALLAFLEAWIWFALVWLLNTNLIKEPNGFDALDALYFSGITIATVGYGDVVPAVDSWGRALAIFEGFSGLYLIGALVAGGTWLHPRSSMSAPSPSSAALVQEANDAR